MFAVTDIDECALQIHSCQQECSNTAGSYVCSCRTGYELADDKISCIGMYNVNNYMYSRAVVKRTLSYYSKCGMREHSVQSLLCSSQW